MSKLEEYLAALQRLPIINPTVNDLAQLCPHLSPKEIRQVLRSDRFYFACPPLLIRGGFQVLSFYRAYTETKNGPNGQRRISVSHPASISSAFASRTRASYADGQSHGDIFSPSHYMTKAMQYAESNWGDGLILDDWQAVNEIQLQDPTDPITDRFGRGLLKTKAVLFTALNRDPYEIINDHSRPQSELFDQALSHMTLDPFIASELRGGRGGYIHYNCAYCGAGLALNICNGCHRRFRDDGLRSSWDTPLTPKMVSFLRLQGHVFGVDPKIAWEREENLYHSKVG